MFAARLERDEFDSVVMGHSHRIVKTIQNRRLLIEQGSFCKRLEYQFRDDLTFKNAVNGYAVIHQDENGNTDFNKTNVYYLGSELPDNVNSVE